MLRGRYGVCRRFLHNCIIKSLVSHLTFLLGYISLGSNFNWNWLEQNRGNYSLKSTLVSEISTCVFRQDLKKADKGEHNTLVAVAFSALWLKNHFLHYFICQSIYFPKKWQMKPNFSLGICWPLEKYEHRHKTKLKIASTTEIRIPRTLTRQCFDSDESPKQACDVT